MPATPRPMNTVSHNNMPYCVSGTRNVKPESHRVPSLVMILTSAPIISRWAGLSHSTFRSFAMRRATVRDSTVAFFEHLLQASHRDFHSALDDHFGLLRC